MIYLNHDKLDKLRDNDIYPSSYLLALFRLVNK
jgi:hypothetical protein